MAMRSGWLWLAVAFTCLSLTLGKVAENGLPDREELDSKYLLTNQIVELNEHIEELMSEAKTQTTALKRKDKKIRSLEKELHHSKERNSALELQVSQLKEDLERSVLATDAEKRKLEGLEAQLRKAERALQIAQAGMLKAQREATAKAREVAQSADAWLPPWLSTQAARAHSLVTSRWATHGRPLVSLLHRGVSLKAAQAQKLAKPYLRRFQKRALPVVRSQWKKAKTVVIPKYRQAKRLSVQYYQAAKQYMLPRLSKVQESVDPYVQTVREKSQPFVEQATSFLHPHLEKANDHYQSVVTQATTYHEQLQDSVKGTMGKHQVLARWATKELIWCLASALLALPVVASILVFSSVFGAKKPVKRQRRSPASSSNSGTTPSGSRKPRRPRAVDVKQQK